MLGVPATSKFPSVTLGWTEDGDALALHVEHRDREMPYFGQETLLEAEAKGPLTEAAYVDAKARCAKWSEGIDAVMKENRLDAFVAPTGGPAHTLDLAVGDRGLGGSSTHAAVSGFSNITLPCGEVFGLPVGLSFERDPERPTGTVDVVVAADGQPRFTIHEGVAWDALSGEPAGRAAAAAADALCFGALAGGVRDGD